MGDPAAIEFQEQAIRLNESESREDELRLLEYLTAFRNVEKALTQYQSLPPDIQQSATGLRFKAALWLSRNFPVTARGFHQEAYDLAPNDPLLRLEHELWTLADLDVTGRTQRLLQWDGESKSVPMDSITLQILIIHLMRTDVLGEEAEPFVQAIKRSTEPWEPGYFVYLIWLNRYRPEQVEPEINAAIDDPVVRRRSFVRLMPWLVSNGYMDAAYRLASAEDEEFDHFAQAKLWEARMRVLRHEVEALRACLEKPAWATIRSLRAAYEAWANRVEDREAEPEPEPGGTTDDAKAGGTAWQSALYWLRRETHLADILYQTVTQWGWEPESEDVLFVMASTNHPKQKWAAAKLRRLSLDRKDLFRYLEVTNAALRMNPKDIQLRNDSVYLSSMISPTGEVIDRALQLFTEHQEDSSVRGTLAFVLANSDRKVEALNLFEGVSESRIRDSPEGLAYALALELQDPERALVFARSALPHLIFPQERALCSELIQRLKKRID
jgi:hypothetical protein